MDIKNDTTEELLLNAHEILLEIERRRLELFDKQAYFDKLLSSQYHDIETSNFDAFRGYKAYKDIQRILRFRRVIKREIRVFNSPNRARGRQNSKNWTEMLDLYKQFLKAGGVRELSVKENNEWSNNDKLGKVLYSDIEKEYNRSFGDLDEALIRLADQQGVKYKKAAST